MSDKKISQLDNASTPLAGTELVPMVQSGATVKSLLSTIRSYLFNGTKDFTGGDVNINNNGAGAVFVNVGDTDDAAIIRLNRNGANYIDMPATAGSLIFRTQSGFTTRLTLATNGDTTLNTGNLVIGTSGKGIDFSADGSAAGMTSELLDDYEEGTWTATFTAGTSGTITLQSTHQTGSYTKVGRLVTVTGQFIVDSVASPVGRLRILGLPFAINNSGNEASTAVAITAFTFDPLTATAIVARGVKGESRIEVFRWVNPSIDDVADYVKAGTQIYVSMSYIV